MAETTTRYEHIALEGDVPFILGTTTKVIELVVEQQARGWSPEELQYQHPQLTLGQVYSALAFYSDHQEEFDREIEGQLQHVEQMRNSSKPSPLVKKLRAKKLI